MLPIAVGVLAAQTAVEERDLVAGDVVAEAETAEPKAILALAWPAHL